MGALCPFFLAAAACAVKRTWAVFRPEAASPRLAGRKGTWSTRRLVCHLHHGPWTHPHALLFLPLVGGSGSVKMDGCAWPFGAGAEERAHAEEKV
jgi:hypothetical protein